jgi:phosphate transport system protein
MNVVFQRECASIKEEVMRMSGEIEMRLAVVLKAVGARDAEVLREWMARDNEIDEKEVQIEEECLKILALHQPVACDLRFLIAVLKINSDLERIGDIIVNIAERGLKLIAFPAFGVMDQILDMGRFVRSMLRDCLDSLIEFNTEKANEVIARDEVLDRRNHDVVQAVVGLVRSDTSGAYVEALIQIYTIARYLERMGDHITNIAEDVAYLVDGAIIRHQQLNESKG